MASCHALTGVLVETVTLTVNQHARGHALTGVLVETYHLINGVIAIPRHALTGVLVETLLSGIFAVSSGVTPSRAC